MTQEEADLIKQTLMDAMAPKQRPGIFTSEFWAMIGLVCLAIMQPVVGMDAQTFQWVAGVLVAYIGSRTGVKLMGKDK